MTRHCYLRIASLIRDTRHLASTGRYEPVALFDLLAEELAGILRDDNPAFKKDKFLAAIHQEAKP